MKMSSLTLAAVLAAGTVSVASAQEQMMPESLISVDEMDDNAIYRLDVEADDATWASGNAYPTIDASWTQVGEIGDVLLDQNGQMVAVLAEIGGFLGIGERDVILPLTDLRFASGENRSYTFITNLTETQLEALPEVDDSIWD
jgi:hypothetical protein